MHHDDNVSGAKYNPEIIEYIYYYKSVGEVDNMDKMTSYTKRKTLTRSISVPRIRCHCFTTRIRTECVLDKPLVAGGPAENSVPENSPPQDATGSRKVVGNYFL